MHRGLEYLCDNAKNVGRCPLCRPSLCQMGTIAACCAQTASKERSWCGSSWCHRTPAPGAAFRSTIIRGRLATYGCDLEDTSGMLQCHYTYVTTFEHLVV